MKYINQLIVILGLLFSCTIVASCSKSGISNPFVGTWSCNNRYYGGDVHGGGVDTFIFKSDNTYQWSCTGNWIWKPETGRYMYNEELGTLTVSKDGGRTTVYLVFSITD
ncbi:MAG: hypothetical protein ACI4TM_01230, partial [Candidatus Cryptobacteroides sp.]